MKSVPRQKGISIDFVGVVLSALGRPLILFVKQSQCLGRRAGQIGGADPDPGFVAGALHAAESA